jgi:hypothetical protein
MSYVPPSLTTYATTLANATASGDTTICTFVVPGGTWADGEMVTVRIFALSKNNKGTSGNATLKVNATGGSAATIGAAVSWADSATEAVRGMSLEMVRAGSKIAVWPGGTGGYDNAASPVAYPIDPSNFMTSPGTARFTWHEVTPTNFTSDVTVSLIMNLDATHATFYCKPQTATAMKSAVRVK